MAQAMRNVSRGSVAILPRVSVHKSLVKKLQSRPKVSAFTHPTMSVQARLSALREAKVARIRGTRKRCPEWEAGSQVNSPQCR